MVDATRTSRRAAIWQAFFSWGMAVILFAVVQVIRLRLIAMFGTVLDIGPGFIPLAEPNQSGPGTVLGRFYRVMHNLTVPYVMAVYVAASVLAFLLFRRKNRSQRATELFSIACSFVHSAFVILWVVSQCMPVCGNRGTFTP